MKRQYLTFTIRKLKVKLSHVSRTTFKVIRQFFKSRLGIDKRDCSRLTKAEILRVLNYYYNCVIGQFEQVKAALTTYQVKPVHADNFTSVLPKLRLGSCQQWRLIDRADIGEFSDSGIPLYYFQFHKVYPPHYQLDIWDNPDCFMVIAEIGKQLYACVSQQRFNVSDFLKTVEQHYEDLCHDRRKSRAIYRDSSRHIRDGDCL